MTNRSATVDGLRLAGAMIGVLGTASLLFVLTFRERRFEATGRAHPIAEHLLDVAVRGGTRVWAVGHEGRILYSRDGGQDWLFAESGVDTPLAGVAFRDDMVGLAVGYGGVILRTADGGHTWARIPSGVEVYLTAVRFLAGGRALAAGEWSTILASDDDGASWHTVTSGEQDFMIDDVDVTDEGTGWAVGEFGRAMQTSDAGRSWTPRRIVNDESTLFTVDAIDTTEIWIGGADSVLLHSTDGGATWQRSHAPCRATQILRLRFARDRGYAVGRRCVAVTEDGGRSWQASSLGESIQYSWLYGLDVTPDEAWAVGYGEAVFRAGRGDDSWRRVAVRREEGSAGG